MNDSAISILATEIISLGRERAIRLATAESCTGGLISAALTDVPGSSDVLDRGFVTYSNAAKVDMLGVTEAILARHGAVSEATARAMAEGALSRSLASIAIAVTGIAGPGGGSAQKPVGRVHVALARHGQATIHHQLDLGESGRSEVREQTVRHALDMIRAALS